MRPDEKRAFIAASHEVLESFPFRDLQYMDIRRLHLDALLYWYLKKHLAENNGNLSATARSTGLERRCLQRWLARLKSQGLDPREQIFETGESSQEGEY